MRGFRRAPQEGHDDRLRRLRTRVASVLIARLVLLAGALIPRALRLALVRRFLRTGSIFLPTVALAFLVALHLDAARALLLLRFRQGYGEHAIAKVRFTASGST